MATRMNRAIVNRRVVVVALAAIVVLAAAGPGCVTGESTFQYVDHEIEIFVGLPADGTFATAASPRAGADGPHLKLSPGSPVYNGLGVAPWRTLDDGQLAVTYVSGSFVSPVDPDVTLRLVLAPPFRAPAPGARVCFNPASELVLHRAAARWQAEPAVPYAIHIDDAGEELLAALPFLIADLADPEGLTPTRLDRACLSSGDTRPGRVMLAIAIAFTGQVREPGAGGGDAPVRWPAGAREQFIDEGTLPAAAVEALRRSLIDAGDPAVVRARLQDAVERRGGDFVVADFAQVLDLDLDGVPDVDSDCVAVRGAPCACGNGLLDDGELVDVAGLCGGTDCGLRTCDEQGCVEQGAPVAGLAPWLDGEIFVLEGPPRGASLAFVAGGGIALLEDDEVAVWRDLDPGFVAATERSISPGIAELVIARRDGEEPVLEIRDRSGTMRPVDLVGEGAPFTVTCLGAAALPGASTDTIVVGTRDAAGAGLLLVRDDGAGAIEVVAGPPLPGQLACVDVARDATPQREEVLVLRLDDGSTVLLDDPAGPLVAVSGDAWSAGDTFARGARALRRSGSSLERLVYVDDVPTWRGLDVCLPQDSAGPGEPLSASASLDASGVLLWAVEHGDDEVAWGSAAPVAPGDEAWPLVERVVRPANRVRLVPGARLVLESGPEGTRLTAW